MINIKEIDPTILKAVEALKEDCEMEILRRGTTAHQ